MVIAKKIVTVIQARYKSSRLDGKVLKDLYGKALLERVVHRVQLAKNHGEIWIATSEHVLDDLIELTGYRLGVNIFRGSSDDVLGRFWQVAQQSNADLIVRVTADNPFTEPRFIDDGIAAMLGQPYDYLFFENIPYGSGVEIVTKNILDKINEEASNPNDREHVTSYIKRHSHLFKIGRLAPPSHLSRPDLRVTVDTLEDYTKLFKLFHEHNLHHRGEDLTLEQVITYLDVHDLK